MDRLSICNLALGRIAVGSEHKLADYEEDTEAGRTCRDLFPFALRYVARDFPWPFLRTYALGQLVAGTDGSYLYRYAYPQDAAALLAVGPADADFDRLPRLTLQQSDFARTAGGIASDIEGAGLWYTAMPDEDQDIPDHGFCDAVAWLLARELAPALRAEPRYWQMAQTAYLQALPVAEAQALNEARHGRPGLPEALAARG